MGNGNAEQTARQNHSIGVPDGFVLEVDLPASSDFENQGDPLNFDIPEPTPDEVNEVATEVPDGFMVQTEDIFAGLSDKEAELREAKPLTLLERAKQTFTDIVEGGELGRKKRADLVFTIAQKNKLPLTFVDENLESLLKNPAITSIQEIPEDEKSRIAFDQSLIQSLTFGAFDPDTTIQAEFPLQAAAGAVAGGIGLFMTTAGALGALGLTAKAQQAGQAGQAIFTAAPRFLPPAIMTGSTFGTVKGIDKAVEQVKKKEINLLSVGKEATIGFTEGALLGSVGASVGYTRRVFMAGGLGYVSGKAQGYNDTEAIVQGSIWGGIEALGGIGRDNALKQRVVANTRDKLAQYAKAKEPTLTIEQAIGSANRYLSKIAFGDLTNAIKQTPIRYLERANRLVSKMIKDWKNVRNINPLEFQQTIGKPAKAIVPKEPEAIKFTSDQKIAANEVSDLVSFFEPSQKIRTEEGFKVLGGGFPEELANKGYTRKEIDNVARKVNEDQVLTPKQETIFEDMLAVHEKAGAVFAKGEPKASFLEEPIAAKTEEVKTFMKGSKVIDAKGDPKIVFHGAIKGFDKFSKEFIGKGANIEIATQEGFFFSESPEEANEFARLAAFFNKEGAENIIPAFLSVKNPLKRDIAAYSDAKVQKAIKDAKELGNDGVILDVEEVGGKKLKQYIVFKPEQIKSALTGKTLASFAAEEAPLPSKKVTKPILNQSQLKRIKKKKENKKKLEKITDVPLPNIKLKAVEMVRQRRAEIDLGNFDTNNFINEIEKVTTKEQRELLPFIIEETGVPEALGRPDLIELFKTDAVKLKPLAKQVKAHFDQGWKFMQDNMDDISAEQIEKYVTHIWNIPKTLPQHKSSNKNRKSEISNWFITRNKFLKKRYIATYKEGIELGLKPKNLDISSIIRIHDNIMHKTIANRHFLDELKKLKVGGLPLVERADKAPMDWVLIDNPALSKNVFIAGELQKGERLSDELVDILNQMGLAIGRRISPTVFGKPSKKEGHFKTGVPPEIAFQRFFRSSTVAHEIGHFLDESLQLGENFVKQFKNEIYALNRDRIKRLSKQKGTISTPRGQVTMKKYAESVEEQIAEFFAFLFHNPKVAYKKAPNASKFMVEKLRKDGVLSKLVDFDFENNAKNLFIEQANTLVKLPARVHPDLEQPLRVVFDQRFNHPIISAYESLNAVFKKMQLSVTLFHHFALGETSIATMGFKNTTDIAFNMNKIIGALSRGEFDVYTKAESSKKWIERGLQIGATADIPVAKIQRALDEFATATKNRGILGKASQFIASFNENWDKALWNYYHDTLKIYAVEHLAAHIDPKGDVVKQEQEIAQLVNDTFGGQNWDNLLISPKTLQIMSWGLLSPDWTFSTIRQGLAFTGVGEIHKETKPFRKKLGQWFWLKAGIYFGIGINLLNVANRRMDQKKNPDQYKDAEFNDFLMWGNALGHKSHLFAGRYTTGEERYIRWGKQFREVPELLFDDLSFSPVSASLKKVGGKLSPNIQLASAVFTGHSPSGFEVRDISEAEGWERTWGIMKQILKTPIPFSSRNILDPERESFISDIAMPSSKGMTRFKVIKLFKIGIERQDERVLKEVYKDAVDNKLPAHTLLRAAATSIKAEQTKDLKKKAKTIDDIDELLPQTQDVRDKKRLLRQKKRMMKEQAEVKIIIDKMEIFEADLKKLELEFDFNF